MRSEARRLSLLPCQVIELRFRKRQFLSCTRENGSFVLHLMYIARDRYKPKREVSLWQRAFSFAHCLSFGVGYSSFRVLPQCYGIPKLSRTLLIYSNNVSFAWQRKDSHETFGKKQLLSWASNRPLLLHNQRLKASLDCNSRCSNLSSTRQTVYVVNS